MRNGELENSSSSDYFSIQIQIPDEIIKTAKES